jgi:hypothetical protein
MLADLPCSRFILVSESDFDAKKDTDTLAEELSRLRREVWIFDCPPDEDPASLGRDVFSKLVRNNSIKYTWSNSVLRKLEQLV